MAEFAYAVEQIGEKDYMISEGFATMFLLCGDSRALLIDCGLGVGDLARLVDRLSGGLPVLLAATHAHVDHIGGRGQFSQLMIPAAEAKYIRTCKTRQRRQWLLRKQLVGKAEKTTRVAVWKNEPQVCLLRDGDVLDLGGRKITALATPGHTRGSFSFWDAERKIVYAGDAVSTYLFLWLPHTAAVETALGSMRRIRALAPELVWPCHHRRPFDAARLERTIHALEALCEKKNALLPRVARFRMDGNLIFYRTDLVHEKKR